MCYEHLLSSNISLISMSPILSNIPFYTRCALQIVTFIAHNIVKMSIHHSILQTIDGTKIDPDHCANFPNDVFGNGNLTLCRSYRIPATFLMAISLSRLNSFCFSILLTVLSSIVPAISYNKNDLKSITLNAVDVTWQGFVWCSDRSESKKILQIEFQNILPAHLII